LGRMLFFEFLGEVSVNIFIASRHILFHRVRLHALIRIKHEPTIVHAVAKDIMGCQRMIFDI